MRKSASSELSECDAVSGLIWGSLLIRSRTNTLIAFAALAIDNSASFFPTRTHRIHNRTKICQKLLQTCGQRFSHARTHTFSAFIHLRMGTHRSWVIGRSAKRMGKKKNFRSIRNERKRSSVNLAKKIQFKFRTKDRIAAHFEFCGGRASASTIRCHSPFLVALARLSTNAIPIRRSVLRPLALLQLQIVPTTDDSRDCVCVFVGVRSGTCLSAVGN